MAPDGLLSLTAYQPGSDTAMIQASWIVPASEQIVSDGPLSGQKGKPVRDSKSFTEFETGSESGVSAGVGHGKARGKNSVRDTRSLSEFGKRG